MQITRKLLRQWRACYTDQELAETVPEEGLTPMQVCNRDDVPPCDRVWVLLHHEILGDALHQVLAASVERAIRLVLGKSAFPIWESWADCWLSGEDRTADTARAVADLCDASDAIGNTHIHVAAGESARAVCFAAACQQDGCDAYDAADTAAYAAYLVGLAHDRDTDSETNAGELELAEVTQQLAHIRAILQAQEAHQTSASTNPAKE